MGWFGKLEPAEVGGGAGLLMGSSIIGTQAKIFGEHWNSKMWHFDATLFLCRQTLQLAYFGLKFRYLCEKFETLGKNISLKWTRTNTITRALGVISLVTRIEDAVHQVCCRWWWYGLPCEWDIRPKSKSKLIIFNEKLVQIKYSFNSIMPFMM